MGIPVLEIWHFFVGARRNFVSEGPRTNKSRSSDSGVDMSVGILVLEVKNVLLIAI